MRAALWMLAAVALVAGCGDDDDGPTDDRGQPPAALRVSTPAFINGSRLQKKYTCDGAGEEPAMFAGTVPPSTRELALVVTDSDAPGGTFVHVTRYGIPRVGDGAVDHGGKEGLNSKGEPGWTPPCPPEGDKTHHYVWTVYATRDEVDLPAGAEPAEVTKALDQSDVLARGTITALYAR